MPRADAHSAGRFLLLALLGCSLGGCAQLSASFRKAQEPAPAYSYGQSAGDSAGMYSVTGDDTVWSVAQRYGLSMQDIIRVNSLPPPYKLSAGQRIVLPPPATYRVRGNDNLYSVSRTFNVSPSELARQNGLRPPYALSAGQTLRLPAPRVAPVLNASVPVRAPAAPVYASRPRSSGFAPESAPPMQVAANRPEPVTAVPLAAPPSASPSYSGSAYPPQPAAASMPETANTNAAAPEPIVTRVPPRAGTRFAWPVNGSVISGYGPKPGGLHNDGINIRAPRGTTVKAADNGVVVYAGSQLKGFGNLVLIRHADRWMTAYAHLQTLGVKRGQEVRQGAAIGTVGATGAVSDPQLHFEVRRDTDALNPELYLVRRGS